MVIDRARELGIALSESPEFQRMQQARRAIDENEALRGQIELLNEKQKLAADILSQGEDAEHWGELATISNEIDDIQADLLSSKPFEEMMDAQQAFDELMQRVNQVIATCIGTDAGNDMGGCCGRTCGSCGGCVH